VLKHDDMSLIDNIFENLSVAVIVCDRDFIVQHTNAACEDLLAISRRKVVGKEINQVLISDSKLSPIMKRAVTNQSRYTVRDMSLEMPEGVDVDTTITPFNYAEETLILIEIDRTDRLKRLMQETSNIEQQKTNRLMMRSMSHEIKNPLSGIRGSAQLLELELDEQELKEFTRVIIKESDRLTNLVNRVMGSHKRYDEDPVNIHYVIEHVAKLVQGSGTGGIKIVRDYDPSLPEFLGDSEQLIQAVLNVVNNGIQAQSDNQIVTIGFRTRLERGFTIDKTLHRQVIRLQIWDDGPGVPEEIREFVFNPMITGRAEGTGLGLSITQEVIQRHGGLINLESYGDKTCFAIYLPLQQASPGEK